MKPIDELTRVIECKVGATWNYASNVVDLDATLAPGFFNGRFPDRQMRVADRVEVTLFDGEQVEEVATLIVTAVEGKQVTVKQISGTVRC